MKKDANHAIDRINEFGHEGKAFEYYQKQDDQQYANKKWRDKEKAMQNRAIPQDEDLDDLS